MTRFRILTFALLALCFSAAAPVAFACSGGPDPITLNRMVENADIIVRGTVVDVDDLSTNAIIRVDEYFAGGSGPQYVLWQREDPVLMAVRSVHSFNLGCTAGLNSAARTSGYFLLARREDGSYESTYFYDTIVVPGGRVYIREEGEPEESLSSTRHDDVSDEQIRAWIVAFSGDATSHLPEETGYPPLPWVAPLNITTNTGATYMLPIDGGDPVQEPIEAFVSHRTLNIYPFIYEDPPVCAEAGCRIETPDGAQSVILLDGERITLDYAYRSESAMNDSGERWTPREHRGEAFTMSPGGNSLAVLHNRALVFYTVGYASCGCSYGRHVPSLGPTAEAALTAETPSLRWFRWSGDGSTFVYSDGDDLWLIDILRGSQAPVLLAGADTGTAFFPLHVSQRGRYVSYTTDLDSPDWTTLDRMTGETYPNRLPAPSETVAVFFPTEAHPMEGDFATVCDGLCSTIADSTLPFIWYESHDIDRYWQFFCDDRYGGCSAWWDTFNHTRLGTVHDGSGSIRVADVLDISYEPRGNLLAILESPQRVLANGVALDLTGKIDGDIVDIRWQRPLFFYWD